ncbi:hypothetical protein AbraCBS73388_011326, partial [Aspergillus brasiliensis]
MTKVETAHHTPSSVSKGTRDAEIIELEGIARRITNSDCSVRSTYGQDLQLSIAALRKKEEQSMGPRTA